MTILPISDFHYDNNGLEKTLTNINSLNPADVIIVAGDFSTQCLAANKCSYPKVERDYLTIFTALSKKYPNVLYVPGNHDYWYSKERDVLKFFDSIDSKFTNVKRLKTGDPVTINGQRFLGDTMFFLEKHVTVDNQLSWPDFITNSSEVLSDHCEKFLSYLDKELTTDDIVVTHHAPHTKSVGPAFIGNPVNKFFVTEEAEDIIVNKQPKLWIHGHMHDPFDYTVGNSRVYCNPIGYKHETRQFKTKPLTI